MRTFCPREGEVSPCSSHKQEGRRGWSPACPRLQGGTGDRACGAAMGSWPKNSMNFINWMKLLVYERNCSHSFVPKLCSYVLSSFPWVPYPWELTLVWLVLLLKENSNNIFDLCHLIGQIILQMCKSLLFQSTCVRVSQVSQLTCSCTDTSSPPWNLKQCLKNRAVDNALWVT